jgi:hypothetical protein
MAQRSNGQQNKDDGGAEEKLMERVRCVLYMCAPLFKGMDIKFAGMVRLHYVDSVMQVGAASANLPARDAQPCSRAAECNTCALP